MGCIAVAGSRQGLRPHGRRDTTCTSAGLALSLCPSSLQITAVIQEREMKLRQAMRTMGMLDSAFWLTWATYEVVFGFVTAMLLTAFGAMWQVRPRGGRVIGSSIPLC